MEAVGAMPLGAGHGADCPLRLRAVSLTRVDAQRVLARPAMPVYAV